MTRFVPHRRLLAMLGFAALVVIGAVAFRASRPGPAPQIPAVPEPAAETASATAVPPPPAATDAPAAEPAATTPNAADAGSWLPVRVCDYIDDAHFRPVLGEMSIVTRPAGTNTRNPSCRWWPYEGPGAIEIRIELDRAEAAASLQRRRAASTVDAEFRDIGDGAYRFGTSLQGTAAGIGYTIDIAPDAVAGPEAIVGQLPELARVVAGRIEGDVAAAHTGDAH